MIRLVHCLNVDLDYKQGTNLTQPIPLQKHTGIQLSEIIIFTEKQEQSRNKTTYQRGCNAHINRSILSQYNFQKNNVNFKINTLQLNYYTPLHTVFQFPCLFSRIFIHFCSIRRSLCTLKITIKQIYFITIKNISIAMRVEYNYSSQFGQAVGIIPFSFGFSWCYTNKTIYHHSLYTSYYFTHLK